MATIAPVPIATAAAPGTTLSNSGTATPSLQGTFERQPTEQFTSNEVVFVEGDPATSVFLLSDGVLRLCRLLPDGRRSITGFALPGDFVGLSFRSRYVYTAEAVTRTRLRRLYTRQLQVVIHGDVALQDQAFTMICDELSAAQDQMLLLGRKTARERLASFLLTIGCKLRKRTRPNELILPFSRQDIADYLGLTIETVSRTMTIFRKEGIIDLPDPQRVIIQDPQALSHMAGEGEQEPADPPDIMRVSQRAAWPS